MVTLTSWLPWVSMAASSLGHCLPAAWHGLGLPWLLSLVTPSDSSAGMLPSSQLLNVSFVEILSSAHTSYPAAPEGPSKWSPDQTSLPLLVCISTLLNKAKLKLPSSKWATLLDFLCQQYSYSLLPQTQNPQPPLVPSSAHAQSASSSVSHAVHRILTSVSFEFFLPHLSLGLSATGRNHRPSYSPRSFYSSLYASSPMYTLLPSPCI